MPYKTIDAIEARVGSSLIVDGIPCIVRSIDISKTGKHGASKCRIEAVGIINGQKKIFVCPGHEKLEVPLIEKRKGQIISIGENASVMDLENFETFDIPIDENIKQEIKENNTVEYWNVEGERIIKRKL
jgi:translation initiation factor 5A